MEYHVSKSGCDYNSGTVENPFLTISKAAAVACENDTVVVHEGEYRECVTLTRVTEREASRITFKAADGEKVVVKGSEIADNWEKHSGTVYKAVINNDLFGLYNPYSTVIDGDWFVRPIDKKLHTGQVYINGASLREVTALDEVKNNNWYAEVNGGITEIYADFGGLDPAENTVEINVREHCFFAAFQGVNYVTISGFEICHCATRWSPPTGNQSGAVCANWCKGWIIENNHIHNSRCNGICIGKDSTTGDNYHTEFRRKSAHFYQVESVFSGLHRGWSKEMVGSHIIRNNTIHDCGQTGIVGHMGCAFSEVYGNHIYNIQKDDEFFGHEIAGIKFHAAIDTYIHHNNIHNCRGGMWLDWQAQGARVSSNLFFENIDRNDLMAEVCHGPLVVDNNLFLSKESVTMVSHGTAFVNNFFGGICSIGSSERNTPYHMPHSTEIKGFMYVGSGDDRYYNNVFVGSDDIDIYLKRVADAAGDIDSCCYGTGMYDNHMPSYESYVTKWREIIATGIRFKLMTPVYMNNNSYLAGAQACVHEKNNTVTQDVPEYRIVEEDGKYYFEIDMPESGFVNDTFIARGDNMPHTLFTEARYENSDGSELVIDKDYFGNARGTSPVVGPFENLKPGKQRFLVWEE